MLESILLVLILGIASGTFLTFMDRVDEHNLIVGKFQTLIAYIFGILAAISFIFTIYFYPFLYPLIAGMCIEWIIKGKLGYPSHVFLLFLLALYYGFRFDLLEQYIWYIGAYLGISFFISDYLKSKIDKKSAFYKYFYASYFSKFFSDIILGALLKEPLLILFGVSHAYSSLYIKKHFPGRNP